eukprot:TRINITY_DN10245_c0_g1_i1.p1 TRINITY_DN10245_c0_g1~~TRINITY_DN10245_c0_g1_i1.p1  ORF type:complete len:408 (-),score=125.39 TRINITY_DN10245_c0_g1_i1:86-1309(-)
MCIRDSGYVEQARPASGEPTAMDVDGAEAAPSAAAAEKAASKNWFVDMPVYEYRDHMEIKPTLVNGEVVDWEAAEQMYGHALHTRLQASTSQHPLLMVEQSFAASEQRSKMCEMMFEKFEAPAFFLSKDAVLSAFAAGRASGLVVDVGSGLSRVSPVHDGYILKKGITKNNLAGEAITKWMHRSIQGKGTVVRPHYSITKEAKPEGVTVLPRTLAHETESFKSWMVNDVVRDIKESLCHVSEVRFVEDNYEGTPPKVYELPDGSTVELAVDRFKIPEALLNPAFGDDEVLAAAHSQEAGKAIGLVQMLNESVGKCDPDLRRDLFNNIILTGGGSLFDGLEVRVHNELSETLPSQKIKVVATGVNAERRFSAWIGGSILASLGTFHQLWISKAEYDEEGAHLVEKRCP